MDKPIPPAVATRVANVLVEVMDELRALHDVSVGAEHLASSDSFPLVAGAVCQHVHALLDRCSVELGGFPSGAFDPSERFSDDTGIETEAEHG